jgi:hypothetical protein
MKNVQRLSDIELIHFGAFFQPLFWGLLVAISLANWGSKLSRNVETCGRRNSLIDEATIFASSRLFAIVNEQIAVTFTFGDPMYGGLWTCRARAGTFQVFWDGWGLRIPVYPTNYSGSFTHTAGPAKIRSFRSTGRIHLRPHRRIEDPRESCCCTSGSWQIRPVCVNVFNRLTDVWVFETALPHTSNWT